VCVSDLVGGGVTVGVGDGDGVPDRVSDRDTDRELVGVSVSVRELVMVSVGGSEAVALMVLEAVAAMVFDDVSVLVPRQSNQTDVLGVFEYNPQVAPQFSRRLSEPAQVKLDTKM
jgi:hypothetical protein